MKRNKTPQIIDRINRPGQPLYLMSKSHRRLAEFINQNPEKAIFMTATALGDVCQVSESTVVRFAVALGYKGFPDMRKALRSAVRQSLTSAERFAIASSIDEREVLRTVLRNDEQNLRKTMDSISQAEMDDAVTRLLAARRIYIMGLRSAAPLAQFLYHYLHQILDDVVLVHNATGDVFEEVARITGRDVMVGVSFPRYSARTLECMRFARENGAQVIGLTDSESSPLRETCDVCLCASTDMGSFVDSLAAPMSVINALIVSVGLHRREELAEHFKQLEGIWNAHSVYIDKQHE